MDAVSYSLAYKQAQRIERFIENPDSNSGLVSLPKKISVGESVTIPNGRVVVHPNLEIDGTLTIEDGGELFVPFGGTLVSSDLMHPVDTITDLRNETGRYKYVYVTGYHTKDDGAFGSNMFVWDEDSTETDNGGTIIKCTTVDTGRYRLKYIGAVNVKWFGIKENYTPGISLDNSIKLKYLLENFENIEIVDSNIYVDNFTSSNVVTKVLKLVNSKIVFDGGNIRLTLLNDLVIDLQDNGIINGGLRYAILSADVAVGTTVIPVESGHTFRVGDRVTNGIDTDKSFADANRGADYINNYITAISSNTVTIQNPVGEYLAKPLFKNWCLANSRFDLAGLKITTDYKVDILGGIIEDSSGGYHISTNGSGTINSYGTNYRGQGKDAFRVGDSSSMNFYKCTIGKSYHAAKQLVAYASSGDVVFSECKINRGNYDVEIYAFFSDSGNTLGTIKAYNTIFDGKNTLGVTPEQINSFDGNSILDTYNFIGDGLHVHTIERGSSETIYGGFEAYDCEFINYQRSIAGNSYVFNPTQTQTINSLIFKNCKMDCPPIYFNPTNDFINVESLVLNNIRLKSKTYYPTGNGTDKIRKLIKYSGTTIINNNERIDTHVVNGDFENLTINGGGTLMFGSDNNNRVVGSLDIIDTSVTGTTSGVRKQNPLVSLKGTGSIAQTLFSNSTSYSADIYTNGVTLTWFNIANATSGATGSIYGSLDIIPYKRYPGTKTMRASVAFIVLVDGTVVDVTLPTFAYKNMYTGSSHYVTIPVGFGFAPTDSTIKLRVFNGMVQIGVTSPSGDFGFSTNCTILNKQY